MYQWCIIKLLFLKSQFKTRPLGISRCLLGDSEHPFLKLHGCSFCLWIHACLCFVNLCKMHCVLTKLQKYLKGSYYVAKKNIILCTWCNAMCLSGLRFKKHIFHIPYIIVVPLCPTFLKHVDFYKAHRSVKRGVLWLASYPVRCDWPNTSSVWRKCYATYHIWKHTASSRHGGGDNKTVARIKVTASFFSYTFGRCYANLPT